MRIASVANVKSRFSEYLREAARGPIVVTKNGRPAGVLLAVDDEEEVERLLLAHSPRLNALLDAANERIRTSGGIPHDEFWKRVEGGREGKPAERRKSQPKPRRGGSVR